MSYTLVLEWMPGDLYMSAVTARCTAPTSSYSVVWLPPNKVYQITLYCGSTSLVSFLVGAFRGKAWSYMSKKEKFPLYLTPEKKALLERRYPEDGSRSLTAFIENAIDFYLDYLSANNAGLFLLTSVQSYLDGRLDQLENRISALLFKQAVELDMGLSTLVDFVQLGEEYLKQQRAESVANVKRTNGRLRLEEKVRDANGSDDDWQD